MNDAQSIAAEINNSIGTATKRQHGLLKLASFLEICSSTQERFQFEKNCTFWIKTLFQIFENHPVSLHAKLAHYCFYLIIQNSKNLSNELSRSISTTYIEKSVNLLVSSNDTLLKNSLMCLNELLLCYRAPCSQYRQKIENFIYHKLDSDSNEVIEWASRCYSKLPFLHKNTNNSDMWYSYFKNILNHGNILLNELFDEYQSAIQLDLSNNQPSASASASTSLQSNCNNNRHDKLFAKIVKDPDNLEAYFKKCVQRFKACCTCLRYMFEPTYEQMQVKIRSYDVVQFLKRIFSFDIKKLINNSRMNMESRYLSDIMSDLFNQAIIFAQQYFKVLNTNLLIYSSEISQFLAGFVNNLNEKMFFNTTKLYFDCVADWIKTNGSSSGFDKYSTPLIDFILNFIEPTQKKLVLNDQKNKQSNTDISKIKLDSNFMIDDKKILNSYQISFRNEIVISIFRCLKVFIKNFNHKLSGSLATKIQMKITDTLLLVQYNSSARRPYDETDCRMGLYETLLELCLTQNPYVSAPLSQSIFIFRSALNDNSDKIKHFAQQALLTFKSFTYPVLPQLCYKEYVIEQSNQPGQNETTLINASVNTNQIFNNNSENNLVRSILNFTNANTASQFQNQTNDLFNQNNTNNNNNINLLKNTNFMNGNENNDLQEETSNKLPIRTSNNLNNNNTENDNWLKRKNFDMINNNSNNNDDLSEMNSQSYSYTKAKNMKIDNMNNININNNKNKSISQKNEDSNGNEYEDEDEDEDDDDDIDIIDDVDMDDSENDQEDIEEVEEEDDDEDEEYDEDDDNDEGEEEDNLEEAVLNKDKYTIDYEVQIKKKEIDLDEDNEYTDDENLDEDDDQELDNENDDDEQNDHDEEDEIEDIENNEKCENKKSEEEIAQELEKSLTVEKPEYYREEDKSEKSSSNNEISETSNSLKMNSNLEEQNTMESTLMEVKDMKTALLPNSSTNTNLTDIVETLEIGKNPQITNIDQIDEGESMNQDETNENNDKLSNQKSPNQATAVLTPQTNNIVNIPNHSVEEKNIEEIDENKLKEMCQSFNPDAISADIQK